MSAEASATPTVDPSSRSSVRYCVLATVTSMSVLLYLDRFAVGIASEYIREDLRMNQTQMAWFISAFFWSYALCQVPAGWLSDRFGARVMLTVYIIAWSAFTGLMGVAHSVWMLLWLRLFCGVAQAGAYPTAVGLVRHWYPVSLRGTVSSIVGLGGRFGGVLAPVLTAWLIVFFVSVQEQLEFSKADILNEDAFLARFESFVPKNKELELDAKRNLFVSEFIATLPLPEQDIVTSAVRSANQRMVQKSVAPNKISTSMIDLSDWMPRDDHATSSSEQNKTNGLDEIVEALSARMSSANFIDFNVIPVKLPRRGKQLLDRRNTGESLTEAETSLLNRFALESLFPLEIRKFQGRGWRPTIVLYGIVGIIVAAVFSIVVRNSPKRHPWCNAAEKSFIDDEATRKSAALDPQNPAFPWRAFLTDLSLWGNSVTQFLTNVGWLFIVTTLPRYLEKVHGVSLVTIGIMTAFPIGTGIVGMFAGGRWTDWAVRRFGLKWGRRIPLVISRLTAAGGYFFCLLLGLLFEPSPDRVWLPWMYVGGLCIASLSADLGTPSIWAYCQDVGGRYTASILGWGNMWGNLGAAVAPFIYNRCLGETPGLNDWNLVFGICCLAFVISCFSAMLLDATRPLTIDRITGSLARSEPGS